MFEYWSSRRPQPAESNKTSNDFVENAGRVRKGFKRDAHDFTGNEVVVSRFRSIGHNGDLVAVLDPSVGECREKTLRTACSQR